MDFEDVTCRDEAGPFMLHSSAPKQEAALDVVPGSSSPHPAATAL